MKIGATLGGGEWGWFRGGPIPLRLQGGVARSAGWLVKGRVASIYARVALHILFEFTNHPVCAAKERDFLLMAQPPLL